jgi:hypothetical protein
LTFREWVRRAFQTSDVEPEKVKTEEPKAVGLEVIKLQRHVAPIYKITGTPTSYKNTMTNFTSAQDEKWANVHTAEDEGCSWVLLLDALQGQERVSRAWDRGPDNLAHDHTISYLMQRKRRCWDFMPLNATKPFATTTICHLVEIMAMLGLVWTDFDVKASLLSAEGNGYMVKSEYTQGLGILTRFSRLSKSAHTENRIIPCKEIKRLCFGEVPSLFDDMGQKLQVGPARLDSCLARLLPGLDPKRRARFLPDKDAKPSILSPTFELVAMVAKSVHIPGSRFRRLPNPCRDAPPHQLNTAACLGAFATMLKECPDLGTHVLTTELKSSFVLGRLDGMLSLDTKNGRTLEQLVNNYIAAHTNLEDEKAEKRYILADDDERAANKEKAEKMYNDALLHLLDALHFAVELVDQNLMHDETKEEMRDVITSHFAALADQQSELEDKLAESGSKEKILVAFYFNHIRPTVVSQPTSSAASTASRGTNSSSEPSSDIVMRRSAIWLGLMFRTWSWLFLHTFNPLDRMIERTEFQNSRLPVYIG